MKTLNRENVHEVLTPEAEQKIIHALFEGTITEGDAIEITTTHPDSLGVLFEFSAQGEYAMADWVTYDNIECLIR